MSGYVPRHSRAPKEDEQSETFLFSVPDKITDSAEEAEEDALFTRNLTATTASVAAEAVASSDDELIENILEADKAVREHPELANPLVVSGEIHDADAEAALVKIRRRRWPVTIAIILAAIIIAGAVTYYVLSSQALERENNRTQGYVQLDEAIALIQESDTVVVSLDEATVTEVTEANLADRKLLLERVPATVETLQTAIDTASGAVSLLTTQEDKDFARHVIDAAENRLAMLDSGEAIINKDIQAMSSALLFGQAWDLIINADSELRATTELAGSGNYLDIQEAIARNGVVLVNLQQAHALLTQASETFPEADYTVIFEYLTLKTESVQLAIEADQALFDGDVDLYNTKNAEFGSKDAAVVEAAGRISATPLTLITDAYEKSTADIRALYDSARANAAEADGYIREYVGVDTQTGVQ